MNDDMARSLAILMEEMCNQMYLLRQEITRISAALEEQPGPELIAEPIRSGELQV